MFIISYLTRNNEKEALALACSVKFVTRAFFQKFGTQTMRLPIRTAIRISKVKGSQKAIGYIRYNCELIIVWHVNRMLQVSHQKETHVNRRNRLRVRISRCLKLASTYSMIRKSVKSSMEVTNMCARMHQMGIILCTRFI
ncbi:hypothetical protein M8C21_009032, partial [Ambrosia artemisiifolia]